MLFYFAIDLSAIIAKNRYKLFNKQTMKKKRKVLNE